MAKATLMGIVTEPKYDNNDQWMGANIDAHIEVEAPDGRQPNVTCVHRVAISIDLSKQLADTIKAYGYKEDALEICRRMNTAFANDIKENGCLHEFYHGHNGQPIMRPGFISWNALGYRVAEDIRNGVDCTTYDMLD